MNGDIKNIDGQLLPSGWAVKKIRDFANILDHKREPLSRSVRSKKQGVFPYCGANGIVDYIDDYRFEGLHVLLAEDGGNFFDYKTRPLTYLMEGKFWVNNHAHVLRAKNGNHLFLHYSLQHKNITSYIIGSTRTKLNKSSLELIPLPIPPVEEQIKIADILSIVDEKIKIVNQQILETEELKKGLMQRMLTKGIGHNELKDSPLGKIPVSWEVVKQSEVATFYNGRAYKLSEWESQGIPVIRLQNLTGSGKEFYYSTMNLPDHQYCNSGDLLYMWSATFGPVFWKGPKAIYHYHIWKIEHSGRLDKKFHFYLLDDVTRRMKNESHGSTMLHVTKGGMEKLQIQLPPLEEQQKIAAVIGSVDEKIQILSEKKSSYSKLKKGLMQQLLTGKIRVTTPIEA